MTRFNVSTTDVRDSLHFWHAFYWFFHKILCACFLVSASHEVGWMMGTESAMYRINWVHWSIMHDCESCRKMCPPPPHTHTHTPIDGMRIAKNPNAASSTLRRKQEFMATPDVADASHRNYGFIVRRTIFNSAKIFINLITFARLHRRHRLSSHILYIWN